MRELCVQGEGEAAQCALCRARGCDADDVTARDGGGAQGTVTSMNWIANRS